MFSSSFGRICLVSKQIATCNRCIGWVKSTSCTSVLACITELELGRSLLCESLNPLSFLTFWGHALILMHLHLSFTSLSHLHVWQGCVWPTSSYLDFFRHLHIFHMLQKEREGQSIMSHLIFKKVNKIYLWTYIPFVSKHAHTIFLYICTQTIHTKVNKNLYIELWADQFVYVMGLYALVQVLHNIDKCLL